MRAYAPGRVNLIGDHTDHTGGWCLPMAIDLGVAVDGDRDGDVVHLHSAEETDDAIVALDVADPSHVEPAWGRFVAGVVSMIRPTLGLRGTVTSTLPIGVGLSSSAALEVAVALALGADAGDRVALAQLCRAAEHAARGVPTGILDQMSSICGVAGHGLVLDCTTLTVDPVPLPPDDEAQWSVITPSAGRHLEASDYATRVGELARAESEIGPLRAAGLDDVARIDDPTIRARARHVVTENARVAAFAEAIAAGDLAGAGVLMDESHASLRDDFESSTTAIDATCAGLSARPAVFGARITGGGWGGSIVALARPGALDDVAGALVVVPSDGAHVDAEGT